MRSGDTGVAPGPGWGFTGVALMAFSVCDPGGTSWLTTPSPEPDEPGLPPAEAPPPACWAPQDAARAVPGRVRSAVSRPYDGREPGSVPIDYARRLVRLFAEHEQIIVCHDEASGLRAIIAVHDTTLGPGLGGIRMWTYPSDEAALTDVLRLSEGMTYKNALAGLDLGGGKTVVVGDPRTDKTPEKFQRPGPVHRPAGRRLPGRRGRRHDHRRRRAGGARRPATSPGCRSSRAAPATRRR